MEFLQVSNLSYILTYFFCQKGNSKYEAEGPKFHMGFPREYQVCHKYENDISDMGAPTYWRLSRLQTQMTSEGTKDTTQEPEVTTPPEVNKISSRNAGGFGLD